MGFSGPRTWADYQDGSKTKPLKKERCLWGINSKKNYIYIENKDIPVNIFGSL